MKHGCKHAPRGETFNISPHQKGFLVPSTLCALYRRRLSGLRAHDRRVRGTALPLPSPSITRHTEAEGAPSSPPRPFPSPISRTLLVRDLALDIVDSIAALNLERDGLAREGLDEDLHRRLSSRVLSLSLSPSSSSSSPRPSPPLSLLCIDFLFWYPNIAFY